MMRIAARSLGGALAVVILASALASRPAAGQLRPYEPFAWEIFDPDRDYALSFGGTFLWGQRASLAGTEGRLLEIGTFQGTARFGRIALEGSGTLHRILFERRAFAAAAPMTREQPLGRRSDAGDYRVSTALLLTPPGRRAAAILRFGTRLPTTDNRVGLERDQTDFFALVGGRLDRGPFRLTLETGVGIHGTREPGYEQSDVLVYALGVTLPDIPLKPGLLLVGHADGLPDRTIRGNEELVEMRAQLRTSGPIWFRIEAIRGFTAFSPAAGVSLAVGLAR